MEGPHLPLHLPLVDVPLLVQEAEPDPLGQLGQPLPLLPQRVHHPDLVTRQGGSVLPAGRGEGGEGRGGGGREGRRVLTQVCVTK